MSGPFGAQRVFPKADSPAPPSPGAGGPLGKLKRVDKKVWMGAGAVVVAGIALIFGRSGESDGSGVDGSDPYELDTTATDVYGELQPELEAIGDGIEDLNSQLEDVTSYDAADDVLSDTPSAAAPAPVKAKKPRKNKDSPRPTKGKPAATGQQRPTHPSRFIPARPRKGKTKTVQQQAGAGPRRPTVQQPAKAQPRPTPRPQPNRVKRNR